MVFAVLFVFSKCFKGLFSPLTFSFPSFFAPIQAAEDKANHLNRIKMKLEQNLDELEDSVEREKKVSKKRRTDQIEKKWEKMELKGCERESDSSGKESEVSKRFK